MTSCSLTETSTLMWEITFEYIGDREQCGQLVMFLILTPNMRPNNQSLSIRFLRN